MRHFSPAFALHQTTDLSLSATMVSPLTRCVLHQPDPAHCNMGHMQHEADTEHEAAMKGSRAYGCKRAMKLRRCRQLLLVAVHRCWLMRHLGSACVAPAKWLLTQQLDTVGEQMAIHWQFG